MTKFTINLKKTKNYIKANYKQLEQYKKSISVFMNSINNADAVWNDVHTQIFINLINKDKKSFFEYIENIEKTLDEINDFCIQLNNIINSSFKLSNIEKIKYNSFYVDKSIEYLENGYIKLNNIINSLESINFSMLMKDKKNYILSVCTKMKNYKIIINDTIEKLKKINKDLKKLLNDKKYKINKIDFITIDSSKLEYKYDISHLNLKK